MGFELTVLGSSGTFPTAENNSTGFLMSYEGKNVWVDAGTGTFRNLQRYVDYFDLDAVVISHLHFDHFLDLYPLYYALRWSIRASGPSGIPVFAPRGTEEYLGKLLASHGDPNFMGYLVFQDVESGDRKNIAGFDFRFQRTLHPVETMAMRIEAGGRTLVFTADTGPYEPVSKLAEGANVLLSEATIQEPQELQKEVHMTALEAGKMAADAGVERLVLTHIAPGLNSEVTSKLAAEHFTGEIIVAVEHLKLEI